MSILRKLIPVSIKAKIKKIVVGDEKIDIEGIANDIAQRKFDAICNSNNNKILEGKIAVVTGATGFIGEAISNRLAYEGAIVFLGARDEQKVKAVLDRMLEKGIKAFPLIFDVTNEKLVQDAFDKVVSEQGKIDILVNCAGGSARDDWNYLHEQDGKVIERIIDINLKGTLFCSKWAAKNMVSNKCGKIINISSTVGVGGKSGFSDYAAAKAGIIGFTKSLALELGEHGITVNCVTPGIVFRGEFTKQSIKSFTNKNAMNSLGIANDIAYGVSFFASDEANFITGQNLIIDGGRSLGLKGD